MNEETAKALESDRVIDITTTELEDRYLPRLQDAGVITYDEHFVNGVDRIVQICSSEATGIDGSWGTFGDATVAWAGGEVL